MERFRKTGLIILIATVGFVAAPVQRAEAIPIWEIIRQAVKKVIVAVDLKIQRLQNKTIWLQNAQKTLENKLSKLKLNEIAEWTEKHRKLYQQYYNELWEVKNAISTYQRFRQIIKLQERLVEEYSEAWDLVRRDDHFTAEELEYMYLVYSGILDQSVKNLDQILLVINSFNAQMTDVKRLEIVDQASDAIELNYADLREFNAQNIRLSLSRAKDAHEIESVKKLYGLDNPEE